MRGNTLESRYTTPAFGGETYEPELDEVRLTRLLDRVRDLMSDGHWRMLSNIQAYCGGSEASVSARLRDLRKEGLRVERMRIQGKNGVWIYRVVAGAE